MKIQHHLTLLVILCTFSSPAQETHPFSDKIMTIDETDFLPYTQGEIKTDYVISQNIDLNNPSIENAYKENFKRIERIITQWPTIQPPQGIEVFIKNFFNIHTPSTSKHASKPSFTGRTEIWFSCYILDFEGKKYPHRMSAASVDICQNSIDDLSGTPLIEDILLCPRKVADFHGMPVYQTTRNEVTVMSKKGIPLFVPVSREEYLNACIRQAESALAKEKENQEQAGSPREFMDETYQELLKIDPTTAAEFKKEMELAMPELEAEPESISKIMLASFRAELEKMGLTERKSQAFYHMGAMEIYNNHSGLVPTNNKEDAEPLVKINPLLIDYSRPNDLQLITLRWNVGRSRDKPRLYNQGSKGYQLKDYRMFQLYNNPTIWKQISQLVVQ